MTLKQCLITLILTGLSATGLAQTGSLNCQGLVGGAMALCLQGLGPDAAPATPRQETRARAGSEGARPGTEARAGANDTAKSSNPGSSRWSVLDWLGLDGSSFGGSSGKCEGLVGGAMAQCMQDIASGSGSTASSRQDSTTAGTETARSSLDSVTRNFRFGGNSLNCQGLVGGAMAQCLQGN